MSSVKNKHRGINSIAVFFGYLIGLYVVVWLLVHEFGWPVTLVTMGACGMFVYWLLR